MDKCLVQRVCAHKIHLAHPDILVSDAQLGVALVIMVLPVLRTSNTTLHADWCMLRHAVNRASPLWAVFPPCSMCHLIWVAVFSGSQRWSSCCIERSVSVCTHRAVLWRSLSRLLLLYFMTTQLGFFQLTNSSGGSTVDLVV